MINKESLCKSYFIDVRTEIYKDDNNSQRPQKSLCSTGVCFEAIKIIRGVQYPMTSTVIIIV